MRVGVQGLLLFSVFVVATCGLVYELVAGTLASYLLGDSVTQFSTIIGAYLFSMGIGSYLSRFFDTNLIRWFIRVELLVALVGGFSSSLLFVVFEQISAFRLILYGLVGITGILVGLEIPLIMRILENRVDFKELVSRVFTFDYIGALIASVLFPLLLIPQLGILKTSFMFGILNAAVGLWMAFYFNKDIKPALEVKLSGFLVLISLVFGFIFSDGILKFSESLIYPDKVVYAANSPYQRVVLTYNDQDIYRLYLNGNLQFSSRDEYRYHEALVHPGLAAIDNPKKILVLGGGDGMAVRESLLYSSIERIVLVDLDTAVTRLFTNNSALQQLNKQSLLNEKVEVINADAFQWLKNTEEQFDFIIIDFPDPSNYSIGKLYSTTFYNLLQKVMRPEAKFVVQSTSPYVAPQSFWCIAHTLQASGFSIMPYHTYVPSFGEWGFIMGGFTSPVPASAYPDSLKYISPEVVKQMLLFPNDMAEVETEVNKLNNQALVNVFEAEWSAYQL